MIEIIPLDGSQRLQFENYEQLFEYINESENIKLLKDQADQQQINWSFTIYHSKQVAALYSHSNNPNEAIREAYEEEFPLIEICAGSYLHPSYVVNTPNVDMDYLKRKWCLDFCTYHDFLLKDYTTIDKKNWSGQWGHFKYPCLSCS